MTKIEIVSGFLGAGKTTLIKKLLKEAFAGEKLVLIENEFGEIGVDGGFLKEAGIEITEMNSGCICCSLVGDFGTALKEVLEKYSPDRVIIEPSGVGKLSDVVKAVEAVGEKVNSSVTVVDGQKCNMYMKNFGEFFNNQIENAGTIVISRTQKMKEDKLAKCVAQIKEKNDRATIITTPWDEIDGKIIVNAMEHIELDMHDDHHHEHDEHYWTSSKNAIKMINAILKSIIELDNEKSNGKNITTYQENANSYIKMIENLSKEIKNTVDNSENKLLIFGDRFPFTYFTEEYGLNYLAAFDGCSTAVEAKTSKIAELIDEAKNSNAKAIFTIEMSNKKIANTIAQASNAKVLELHSCQNVSKDDFERGITYAYTMKSNLDALKIGL